MESSHNYLLTHTHTRTQTPAQHNTPAVVLHPLWCPLQPQDACAAADEVSGVVVGVEAYQVRLECGAQHLLTHRQGAVDLTAGEGGVQEPANLQDTKKYLLWLNIYNNIK
jgi:hypothetical protein